MTLSTLRERRLGVALLLAGTLLIAIGDSCAKWLAAYYSTSQITFIRSAGGILLVLLFMIASGKLAALRTSRHGLHAIRAVLVTFVMLGVFYALGRIPMVEVEAIGHAATLFVALLSPLIVGEQVTGHNWSAIILGFIGVLIMLRPDPAHFHIAHLLMFGCAVAYAILILIARRLTSTDSVLAINFYIYPLSCLITGVLVLDQWIAPAPSHWLVYTVFIVCNTCAVLLFLTGLRHVGATLAATLDYFTLIWVALIGGSFWGEIPSPVSTVGILLIVASGIYIVRHSTRQMDESLVQSTEH